MNNFGAVLLGLRDFIGQQIIPALLLLFKKQVLGYITLLISHGGVRFPNNFGVIQNRRNKNLKNSLKDFGIKIAKTKEFSQFSFLKILIEKPSLKNSTNVSSKRKNLKIMKKYILKLRIHLMISGKIQQNSITINKYLFKMMGIGNRLMMRMKIVNKKQRILKRLKFDLFEFIIMV